MHGEEYILEILFFLAAAVAVVPVFKHFKLSSILGYLTAGFLIGPTVLGLVHGGGHINTLAEFGIVFLLFLIGMELSFERLKQLRRYIFGVGGLQVILTTFVFSMVAGWAGQAPEESLVIGLALALSSTAFVMQLVQERDEQITRHGRIAFSILLLQDLAVVPILALIPILAKNGLDDGGLGPSLLTAFGTAVVAIVGIIFIGRLILRPLYKFTAMAKTPELFPAMTLLILFGTGYMMHMLGISMTLGAFLCGLLIAETEYRHQVEADIAPFKGLLMGIFFMTVGIGFDLALVLENLNKVLLICAGILAAKSAIISLLCFAFGITWPISRRVGLLLSQGGEFAFVIFGMASMMGVMQNDVAQVLIASVALTMLSTPLMDYLGRVWNTRLYPVEEQDLTDVKAASATLANHVIIAGFGRVGQTAARMLSSFGIPYVALDLSHSRTQACYTRGMPVYYGDATSLPIMRDAQAEKARAVLLTLDNKKDATKAANMLKKHFPHVPVISRSHDNVHAQELAELGVHKAVPDLNESSILLGSSVLKAIGASDDVVSDILRKFKQDSDIVE